MAVAVMRARGPEKKREPSDLEKINAAVNIAANIFGIKQGFDKNQESAEKLAILKDQNARAQSASELERQKGEAMMANQAAIARRAQTGEITEGDLLQGQREGKFMLAKPGQPGAFEQFVEGPHQVRLGEQGPVGPSRSVLLRSTKLADLDLKKSANKNKALETDLSIQDKKLGITRKKQQIQEHDDAFKVVLPSGKVAKARTRGGAKDLKDQSELTQKITESVNTLLDIASQTFGGGLSLESRKLAENEVSTLTGLLRVPVVGPGAFNETEIKIIRNMVPNPTALFSLGKVNKSVLKALKTKYQGALEKGFRSEGIKFNFDKTKDGPIEFGTDTQINIGGKKFDPNSPEAQAAAVKWLEQNAQKAQTKTPGVP